MAGESDTNTCCESIYTEFRTKRHYDGKQRYPVREGAGAEGRSATRGEGKAPLCDCGGGYTTVDRCQSSSHRTF